MSNSSFRAAAWQIEDARSTLLSLCPACWYDLAMADLSERRKKLLYRANYRGFKEADIVIGGFAKAHLNELDEAELDMFAALLKIDDRQLYAWVMGDIEPPAEFDGPVLHKMQKYRPKILS